MNCRKVHNLLDDRLDERLDPSSRSAFDAHLADCPECREQWEAYSGAWQILGQHQSIEPSFGFVERTMRRLDEMPASHGHEWLPVFRWAALGLTVVALGLGGIMGWQRWETDQDVAQQEPAAVTEIESFAQINHGSFFEDLEVIASLGELSPENKSTPQ